MFKKRILKKLYVMNVPQSLIIVSILTLPLAIYGISHLPHYKSSCFNRPSHAVRAYSRFGNGIFS